jgi:hypothetical protein
MAQARIYESHAKRQAAYRLRSAQAIAIQLQAKGLPALPALSNVRGEARWNTLLAQAHWSLQTIASEMDDYSNDRSDSWQESERGEAFQERLEEIQRLFESLDLLTR